jgi:DNA polymerase-3 subunit beta
MKFSIARNELQRGLTRIQSIVEKRNTMPILANVLLDATADGQLELAATDLEVGIRGSHPAEVERIGRVTASAKKLYEIVRELPEEPIHVDVSDSAYLGISCARATFQLAGTSADEYPSLPEFSTDHVVAVPAVILSQMIERTMYAASLDETRYNLNGVHLQLLPDAGKLRMVATDGHRMAYVDRALGLDLEVPARGVIIPRKGLAELKRLVEEADADEVELGFEASSAIARKGDVTLVMRLIEGEFPDYQQVIPKQVAQRLVVDTDAMVQALRRVVLLSTERGRAVRVELSDRTLRLSSNNPDLGEAHEELDVDYAGEDVTIAFNARYLLDALTASHAKEFQLELRDSLSPVRLTPTDDLDTLAVVMPMRV